MEKIARLVMSAGLVDAGQEPGRGAEGGLGSLDRRRGPAHLSALPAAAGWDPVFHRLRWDREAPLPGRQRLPIRTDFTGTSATIRRPITCFQAELSTENARVLHALFPFTAPFHCGNGPRPSAAAIGSGLPRPVTSVP